MAGEREWPAKRLIIPHKSLRMGRQDTMHTAGPTPTVRASRVLYVWLYLELAHEL